MKQFQFTFEVERGRIVKKSLYKLNQDICRTLQGHKEDITKTLEKDIISGHKDFDVDQIKSMLSDEFDCGRNEMREDRSTVKGYKSNGTNGRIKSINNDTENDREIKIENPKRSELDNSLNLATKEESLRYLEERFNVTDVKKKDDSKIDWTTLPLRPRPID